MTKHFWCETVFCVVLNVPFLEFAYPATEALVAGSDSLDLVGRDVWEIYIVVYTVLFREVGHQFFEDLAEILGNCTEICVRMESVE